MLGATLDVDQVRNVLLLTFSYRAALVAKIKEIPGRRWNGSAWELPLSRENYARVHRLFGRVADTPAATAWLGPQEPTDGYEQRLIEALRQRYLYPPKDYTFKTKPFDHQLITFNLFKSQNVLAELLDMGLGKTKVLIDIICYRRQRGGAQRVLYVCPATTMDNVAREFAEHATAPLRVVVLDGSRAKRRRWLSEAHDVFVLNYESLHPMLEDLAAKRFDFIAFDESHRIKNPKAQCSKAAHALALGCALRDGVRSILTGTPVTQNAIDIFSQYKALDPTLLGPSYWAFRAEYAIMGGWQNKQIVGYQKLDELKRKIYAVAVRFMKKDCLDLPPKMYETRTFALTDYERTLYAQIQENILSEIEHQKVSASIVLTKMLKLTEIASGFLISDDNKVITWPNASKLQALAELLEDVMPTKVIVWTVFRENIRQIEQLFQRLHLKCVTLSGDTPPAERMRAVDAFQNEPDCYGFIGQIQTGGVGINLTAAQLVIYYTNTYSLEKRLQSEDRAHRIGQTNKVTYVDLIARDTVDAAVVDMLKRKHDFSRMLIDDLRGVIIGRRGRP